MLWITVLIIVVNFVNNQCQKSSGNSFKSAFYDVVQSPAFVDKTLLLKEFLNHSNTSILITAPHGFGKTTNLDMIRRFCELQVSSDGNVVPIEQTESYRVFTAKYMKGDKEEHLDVFKDRQFFDNHFGKYTVIYLDFKSLRGTSYDNFLTAFRRVVAEEFKRHEYLLSSTKLDEGDRKSLNDYFKKIVRGQASKDVLINGIKYLTEVLCSNFASKVIVLIDEYDAAVQDALFHAAEDLEEITNLYRDLVFYLFKFNDNIGKALLNACMRQAGSDLTKGNNIELLFFTRKHNFKAFYGFTKDEVISLATKYKILNEIKNIELWYGGYYDPVTKFKIFHVDSVVKYLKFKTLKSYWPKLEVMGHFQKVFSDPDFRSEIFEVVSDDSYLMEEDVADRVTLKEFHETFRSLFDRSKTFLTIHLDDEWMLFNFLMDLGYLTSIEEKLNYSNGLLLTIPNKQAEQEVRGLIQLHCHYGYKPNVTANPIK